VPPGILPVSGSYVQQQLQQSTHTHGLGTIANTAAASTTGLPVAPAPYTSNGLAPGDSRTNPNQNSNPISNANPNPNTNTGANTLQTHSTLHAQHLQTPEQQVLLSTADRWGLLGLLAIIKNAGTDMDQGLSSVGTDLGTMGLDIGHAG
jgi:CCR4-NOT transcription complex subunit 2